MERLEGVDLWTELCRRKRFTVAEAIRIIRQVLSALHAAHREGIIHRDIKPENIFLHQLSKGATTVKVLDWGLAKVLETATERAPDPLIFPTEEGVTVGTFAYLAPEQLMNRAADARTDIYAAATVLYELVAGGGPFEKFGSTSTALERAKLEHAPEALSSRLNDPSLRELDRVLRKALECNPSQRYQNVAAFDRDLVAVTREQRPQLIPSVVAASAAGTIALLATAYRFWVW
jgi:eukaryotic-like serine/threonine-protein kinase